VELLPENWHMMNEREIDHGFKTKTIKYNLGLSCPYTNEDIISKNVYPETPSLITKYCEKLYPEYNSFLWIQLKN
jgi:hypothetical protein